MAPHCHTQPCSLPHALGHLGCSCAPYARPLAPGTTTEADERSTLSTGRLWCLWWLILLPATGAGAGLRDAGVAGSEAPTKGDSLTGGASVRAGVRVGWGWGGASRGARSRATDGVPSAHAQPDSELQAQPFPSALRRRRSLCDFFFLPPRSPRCRCSPPGSEPAAVC